jgi:uncharacterized protein YueI
MGLNVVSESVHTTNCTLILASQRERERTTTEIYKKHGKNARNETETGRRAKEISDI